VSGVLPTATLGRTGVEVTRLGYGAMELRRGGQAEATLRSLLHAVLDAGINVLDTSPDYGRSEELIGSTIGARRDEYFLASKCGCPIGLPAAAPGKPAPHTYTRANVRAGVEQSLRRLRTDHLDLVQFHGSPSREQLEADRALDELEDLRREGKVRFVAMSAQLPHLADHIATGVFDVFQIPFSALDPSHDAAIQAAAEGGAGVMIRGGVAQGAPSKTADALTSLADAPRKRAMRQVDHWNSSGLDDLLDGDSRVGFLLRYTITDPHRHTTIVGTADAQHLAANVAAAIRGPLPPDVYAEAAARLRASRTR
jgi:aryl-alcohol dehydrogenase-like predicted oxidoreductase